MGVTLIGTIRSPVLIAFPEFDPKTFQLFLFWLVAEHELLRLSSASSNLTFDARA